MRIKNKTTITILVLALLLIVAGVCVYKYMGSGSKEIKVAKDYISMLKDNDMIDSHVDFKDSKSITKSDPYKVEKYYSVIMDKYAIDIDANYNVIGFNDQNSMFECENFTVDEAKNIAEDYVKKLYDGECIFKEVVKEEESQKIPYYTFIFAKSKDGIPYYNYSVSLKINKETGKLNGFSNSSINIEPKENVISVSIEDAENTVKQAFSKLNTFSGFSEETYKSYCEDKDRTELELCYVVNIKGIDSSGKDINMKYFVSTETGEIINSEKNNVLEVTT